MPAAREPGARRLERELRFPRCFPAPRRRSAATPCSLDSLRTRASPARCWRARSRYWVKLSKPSSRAVLSASLRRALSSASRSGRSFSALTVRPASSRSSRMAASPTASRPWGTSISCCRSRKRELALDTGQAGALLGQQALGPLASLAEARRQIRQQAERFQRRHELRALAHVLERARELLLAALLLAQLGELVAHEPRARPDRARDLLSAPSRRRALSTSRTRPRAAL